MKPSALVVPFLASMAWSCDAGPENELSNPYAPFGEQAEADRASSDAAPEPAEAIPEVTGDARCTLEPSWHVRGSCPVPGPLFPGIDPGAFAPLPGYTDVDPLDVHPVAAVDYWEVRYCFAGFACVPTLSFGTRCGGAHLPAACLAAVAALDSSHGFAHGCEPLACYAYLVGTRGDQAFLVADARELVDFLAPFDSIAEAALMLYASGFLWWSDSVAAGSIRAVADGWEVLAVRPGQPCDPITWDRYLLHLSRSGQVTPLCRQLYRADCQVCF
jgi:hypothetical protein